MKYYESKTIDKDFEESVKLITEELKKEGFGVITEIKMHEKFKEKLDVEYRKYAILGACNPRLAHEALAHDDKIGILLPCNVIVQELEDGRTEVAAMDPFHLMKSLNNAGLTSVAEKVSNIMKRVIHNL